MTFRTPTWEQNYYRALPWLLGAQERGMSMSEWIRTMRDIGYGYNSEQMRTDWRVNAGFQYLKTEYRHLSEDAQVPIEFTSLGENLQNYRFLGLVQYEWFDPNLGEWRTSTWAVGSSELERVGDYVGTVRELFGERGRYVDPSARNFRLVGVLRRSDVEY